MTRAVLYAAVGKERVSPIVVPGLIGISVDENPLVDDARRGANHMPAFAQADTAAAAD